MGQNCSSDLIPGPGNSGRPKKKKKKTWACISPCIPMDFCSDVNISSNVDNSFKWETNQDIDNSSFCLLFSNTLVDICICVCVQVHICVHICMYIQIIHEWVTYMSVCVCVCTLILEVIYCLHLLPRPKWVSSQLSLWSCLLVREDPMKTLCSVLIRMPSYQTFSSLGHRLAKSLPGSIWLLYRVAHPSPSSNTERQRWPWLYSDCFYLYPSISVL